MGKIRLFKLVVLLIWNPIASPDLAHAVSITKPVSRTVTSNGGTIGAAKSNAVPIKACPTALFTFQSPYWQTQNTNFAPFIAGRDFVGDVRICRFHRLSESNDNEYAYGFEYSNGILARCISNFALDTVPSVTYPAPEPDPSGPIVIPPALPIVSLIYGVYSNNTEYEVLYVPKSLTTDWVTQRTFPKFPNLSPAPMSVKVDSVTSAFLARCKVIVDNDFDPSIVISIPGIIFPFSDPSSLEVSYNGLDYRCDQDDLEFPVCL